MGFSAIRRKFKDPVKVIDLSNTIKQCIFIPVVYYLKSTEMGALL